MRASPQHLLSFAKGDGPIYLQIYHRIRKLILTGAWPPGTRLPSSRSLARDLGVSRTTALLAIDQLMADGWIAARAGSGIFVSADAPPVRGAALSDQTQPDVSSPRPIPFQISETAVDLFPVSKWAKIQAAVWSQGSEHALHEGSGAGWLPLRRSVASYLHAVRGLNCAPDQIIIMPSATAAADLCVRVLGRPGDPIWIEDPGYPYARESFQSNSLKQIPVPVDAEGLSVPEALRLSPRARFAYVTPACQFPTCVPMSAERSSALLSWASETRSYIVEDDWDFNAQVDQVYAAEPLAARNPDRTLYIHSFNRLLFPALRIAALVVPLPMVERFVDARRAGDGFANMQNQMALADFIDRGHLSAHLRTLRQAASERRSAMHLSLAEHLGDVVSLDSRRPGFHTLAWCKKGADSRLALDARRAGFACSALSDFALRPMEGAGALLLGFMAFEPRLIENEVRKLAAILNPIA